MSLVVTPIGDNPTRMWGLTARRRLERIAARMGARLGEGGEIQVNLAYAFDPAWLRLIAARPGAVVTKDGVSVLANGVDARAAMEGKGALPADAEIIAQETFGDIVNDELRKREQPFMERLTPDSVAGLEETSYRASYKGVTDLLTKYLWPRWAFHLTRLAARIGLSPNMVTSIGAVLCAVATACFWFGHYWAGMASGLVFMVLDTVDGKLARCTITSSKWGEAFDHGIDLVHPLIWWYAWGVGLESYGRPLDPPTFWTVMIALAAGYIVQRLIEGAFIASFGMHIHVWRKVDSDFRLITARRNPNMVILFMATLAMRPDIGLVAVAVWTVLSCLFHLVRLAQAYALRWRGGAVRSWLE